MQQHDYQLLHQFVWLICHTVMLSAVLLLYRKKQTPSFISYISSIYLPNNNFFSHELNGCFSGGERAK